MSSPKISQDAIAPMKRPPPFMYVPDLPSKREAFGKFLVTCLSALEFGVMVWAAWFGAFLLLPFDTFSVTPAWAGMIAVERQFHLPPGALEYALGSFWLVVGLIGWWGVVGQYAFGKRTRRLRRVACTAGCILWLLATILLWAVNYMGTGWATYALPTALCGLQTYRLGRGYT